LSRLDVFDGQAGYRTSPRPIELRPEADAPLYIGDSRREKA
jgi:hypothetical protein